MLGISTQTSGAVEKDRAVLFSKRGASQSAES
jgi:hypothetical protein